VAPLKKAIVKHFRSSRELKVKCGQQGNINSSFLFELLILGCKIIIFRYIRLKTTRYILVLKHGASTLA